ncbi:cytochrome P450 [Streptomyces alboniger]|uniref:Cytochrome P450 n=1 Tax=Streptomyces alboniger TaxID=132473 RepID=A0A5J6HNP1_STRAD|nr:cytochrome P450 [Streptomyces alboniger]
MVHGSGGHAFVSGSCPGALNGPTPEGRRPIGSYAQARRFLADPRNSRARLVQVPFGPASAMSVTEMDPPQHTYVRGLLGSSFFARAITRRFPILLRRADALTERMRRSGVSCDVMAEFCVPFAYETHCDVLGVPDEVREELYRWSCARSAAPNARGPQLYRAETGLHRAVSNLFFSSRRLGGLLGELAAAHQGGGLSGRELTGLAASLFFDGHILASNQLANALLCLFVHPAHLDRLLSDPALLDATVEETLRYSPSITMGMTRVTPAGSRAAVAFGTANRDPHVFTEPDRFVPLRTGPRHLSFGWGPHHCLGAELVRAELRAALTVLFDRLPGLRPAAADDAVVWSASATVRGPQRLPVTWDRRVGARRLNRWCT